MWKKLASVMVLALLVCLVSLPAYAAIGVKDDGVYVGEATDIDIEGSAGGSFDGQTYNLNMTQPTHVETVGNMTFQTNLLAIGQYVGASTAASSSTNLAPANLPYSILRKAVGGITGLDATPGTTLQDGAVGQVLTLYVYAIEANGIWNVAPATSVQFSTLQFDAIGDFVTLLYVDDTNGWIVVSMNSVTVANIVTPH